GDLNGASMLFHNALHGVESEAGSLAHTFGREERLEDVCLYLRRNSWTIIADFHNHAGGIAISANTKFSFSVHRVDGVVDQVGPNLVEFAAERIHQQGHALVFALYSHPAPEFVVQDGERAL